MYLIDHSDSTSADSNDSREQSSENKRKCTQILSLNCYLEYRIVKKHKNLIDSHKWKYRVYSISKDHFSPNQRNVKMQKITAENLKIELKFFMVRMAQHPS